MKNKLIKKRNLNTHKGVCKLSYIYFILMIIEIISDDKRIQKTKHYLYCYMNKIISSHVMPTCQVKASSNFPLHSTLHSYTADVLSMVQLCSHSVASSFKISTRDQHATDVHAVLFWGFTWWGRFCLCFFRHQELTSKIQTWAHELKCIYASFKGIAQEVDNLFRYIQFS